MIGGDSLNCGKYPLNHHSHPRKTQMCPKLSGDLYRVTSLLHPSLHQTFLSPCGRQNEKQKIEAIKFLNKNSSLVFPPISFKLTRPTTRPKQCVIRWFSCLSLRANLGCEILITVNGHYKFTIRVYGVPVYTRCQ